MRLIHAVRDLNAENRDGEPIRTIALYTDAEPAAMFVREADVAYSLGPAAARPYLNYDLLEAALLATKADAVVGRLGLRRRGSRTSPSCARGSASPSSARAAEAMRKLGDKVGSKLIAEEVGVPVAPWSRGAVDTLDDARRGGRADRLPADAQGDRRRRRARHPGDPRRGRTARRLPAHPRRGRPRVRQRRRVPRTARHRRPARRGAGHRRQPRHGLGARRARLLGAAAQPEGDRGVGVAAARRRRRPTS